MAKFPGEPVVRTPPSHCPGPPGLMPGRGTKIPQAAECSQKKREGEMEKSQLDVCSPAAGCTDWTGGWICSIRNPGSWHSLIIPSTPQP